MSKYIKPQTPRIYQRGGLPILWYLMQAPGSPFANDTGDVGDLTGNAVAGVRNGGCVWAPGQSGASLSFNGTSSYTTGAALPALTSFSVSAWVNLANNNVTEFALSNRDSGANNGICMLFTDNRSGPYVGYTNGGNLTIAKTLNPLTVGQWCHVVGTHTGGSANLTLYQNGIAGGSLLFSNATDPANTGLPFTLGRDGASATPDYFGGGIDNVQVWNYALSAGQVAREYFDPFWRLRAPRRELVAATVPVFPFGDPSPENPRITPVQMIPY